MLSHFRFLTHILSQGLVFKDRFTKEKKLLDEQTFVFQCTATLASPQGDEECGIIAVVVACWLTKANVTRAGRRWYITLCFCKAGLGKVYVIILGNVFTGYLWEDFTMTCSCGAGSSDSPSPLGRYPASC